MLDPDFYQQPTLQLAKSLLGKRLVRILPEGRISGWIVEVEAYLSSGDEASHSHNGLKTKNRSMYLDPGSLYVYPIHAKWCMNVVSEPRGVGAAVLIRALEPDEGVELAQRFRPNSTIRDLFRGPSRTCQALNIDRQWDGTCLHEQGSKLFLEESNQIELKNILITASSRIGIRKGTEHLFRFFVDGNRFVSGLSRLHRSPAKSSLFKNILIEKGEKDA